MIGFSKLVTYQSLIFENNLVPGSYCSTMIYDSPIEYRESEIANGTNMKELVVATPR
jgi:hypothetical protein